MGKSHHHRVLGAGGEGVGERKQHLVANIVQFSSRPSEKLLIFAAGRPLSFGDKRVVEQIVRDVKAKGNGVQVP